MISNKKWIDAAIKNIPVPLENRLELTLLDMIWRIQNFYLFIFQKILYRKKIKSPKNILIFRTGSLGDSLCAIPSIKAIARHYPGSNIDILTNAGRANLVGLASLLSPALYRDCIDYLGEDKKKLLRHLQHKQYDLVVQLPQVDASFFRLMRDLLLFRLVAPAGFGWQVSQVPFFRKTQARHLIFPNEITRLKKLLVKNGISEFNDENILDPGNEDIDKARAWLNQSGASEDKALIAIAVGAKRPQNRWPIAYFKDVVEHFADDYTIILIGSQEDTVLAGPLLGHSSVKNACGSLTPRQTAALLSFCKLAISNDTGPMHLSYAVGTPTIAIFSSRDLPGKWFPPNGINRVFRAENIFCEACFSETCSNNICMQSIKPEVIISSAQNILRGAGKG